ncbi:MAG: diadenylate cyclase CdaA [Clostridia bacterium]|nr:diadenylate cyclase CdaA [Clostridia bacterium]
METMDFFVESWNGLVDFMSEKVFKTLTTIGFLDIVDIFLLAGIFFFIYRFARKRRAVRLIIGVVLFILIVFVVDTVHLSALGFVFGDFKQLGVIAILIIFQPELRSALEKIGGIKVFDFHAKHTEKDDVNAQYVIESVSRAAQKLSSAGHGALIVIERQNSLAEFKRTGSTVDAVISPDMLCSIFYKGTALHDGAVIVNNGRIDSAACVLPITNRADIDTELGTRHRAAIGTTEVSDAIVVVVSEETGKISMSIDGELERGFTYSSLRNALENILVPKAQKPAKQRTNPLKSVRANKKTNK